MQTRRRVLAPGRCCGLCVCVGVGGGWGAREGSSGLVVLGRAWPSCTSRRAPSSKESTILRYHFCTFIPLYDSSIFTILLIYYSTILLFCYTAPSSTVVEGVWRRDEVSAPGRRVRLLAVSVGDLGRPVWDGTEPRTEAAEATAASSKGPGGGPPRVRLLRKLYPLPACGCRPSYCRACGRQLWGGCLVPGAWCRRQAGAWCRCRAVCLVRVPAWRMNDGSAPTRQDCAPTQTRVARLGAPDKPKRMENTHNSRNPSLVLALRPNRDTYST